MRDKDLKKGLAIGRGKPSSIPPRPSHRFVPPETPIDTVFYVGKGASLNVHMSPEMRQTGYQITKARLRRIREWLR